jgi:hypothetical protein
MHWGLTHKICVAKSEELRKPVAVELEHGSDMKIGHGDKPEPGKE